MTYHRIGGNPLVREFQGDPRLSPTDLDNDAADTIIHRLQHAALDLTLLQTTSTKPEAAQLQEALQSLQDAITQLTRNALLANIRSVRPPDEGD